MLLAIDIGNTNVTIGLFRNGALVGDPPGERPTRARRPTRSSTSSTPCSGSTTRRSPTSRRSSCCSVVPALTAALETIATRRERPLLVAAAGTVPIAIRVDRPADVGADRLVNALAAARLHGTPAIVADFGTATTFDCVAADGAFVGGAIAPGLELGLEALAARTAKLPRVELRAPDRAIGRDTVSAIQSGTILGYQALANGLIARIRAELADGGGRRPGGRPGDPDRRPVGGAVGARPRRRRCDRPGPDPQGPRDPPRRGQRRPAARAGAAGMTRRRDAARHRLRLAWPAG